MTRHSVVRRILQDESVATSLSAVSEAPMSEELGVRDAGARPLPERYCTKLKYACKNMIINKILVEAAGVELIRRLTVRKLLIPGIATTAKKASLPDPLYVYCTKIFSFLNLFDATPGHHHSITVGPAQIHGEKT
jgi:hypothetical protein